MVDEVFEVFIVSDPRNREMEVGTFGVSFGEEEKASSGLEAP